jgi:C1A family cysteine protease
LTDFPTTNLPEKFDWWSYGFVSPVKRMGKCGASYIFSAVGAMESRMMIKLNKTVNPFSEQMFLNCLPENKVFRADKSQGGSEAEVF